MCTSNILTAYVCDARFFYYPFSLSKHERSTQFRFFVFRVRDSANDHS